MSESTGGAVIRSAAVVFELADHAGAASIHRVDNTNAPPIASSSGPLQMPVPHQPPIAAIPELPALPSIGGEQFSSELHSGPGPADLRDFSRAWHNYSQDITHAADDTRSVGMKVNEHWSSGDKAANSVMDHAKWLDSAAAWAERLSVAAEDVACWYSSMPIAGDTAMSAAASITSDSADGRVSGGLVGGWRVDRSFCEFPG